MSKPGPERSTKDPKESIGFVRNHITKHLLTKPKADNQLNHVQALREHVQGFVPDKELSATEVARVELRAKAQARDLIEADSLDYSFNQKKALYESFLKVVESKIVEPKITPELTKATLLSLKAQFETKAKARENAVILTIKIEQANLDIARLEKEAASAVAPVPSSSPAKSSIDQVPIAKTALEGLKKELAEAITNAEKATDISFEFRDAFGAFVDHVLSQKIKVLPRIVHELQFGKPDDKLAQADIDAALDPWKSIADGKAKRLAEVEKKGGKFTGIQARVAEWFKVIPKSQSSDEIAFREKIHPYTDKEDKTIRDERIRLISGLPFRRKQLDDKAVARDKGARAKQKASPVAKQLHELDDDYRREFENLGIKPYPKDLQNPLAAVYRAATGAECWNTEFEEKPSPKSPTPPRKVMLDEGAPLAFPERKQLYSKTLAPLLDRHLKMGVKDGLLVGHKTKATDDYWKAAEDKEVDLLMDTLKKLKI
jgi:hypothetical protein